MAAKSDGPGEHAEAGTAGEARKAAHTAPREDRDRWEEFSKDDAAKLAKERKAGKG